MSWSAEKTMVAVLGAVSKAVLLSLPRTAPLSTFPAMWLRLLGILRVLPLDTRP